MQADEAGRYVQYVPQTEAPRGSISYLLACVLVGYLAAHVWPAGWALGCSTVAAWVLDRNWEG